MKCASSSRARIDAQLPVNAFDVIPHRVVAELQAFGHLFGRIAPHQKNQHLAFALRQFSSVRLIGILALSRAAIRPAEKPGARSSGRVRELGFAETAMKADAAANTGLQRVGRKDVVPESRFVPEMSNGRGLREGENFLAEIGDVAIVVDDLDQDGSDARREFAGRQQIEEAQFFGVVGKPPSIQLLDIASFRSSL